MLLLGVRTDTGCLWWLYSPVLSNRTFISRACSRVTGGKSPAAEATGRDTAQSPTAALAQSPPKPLPRPLLAPLTSPSQWV